MVTIRNPAFGSIPKVEPVQQQAAIIKLSDNGMVTIRSPALQHALNNGLTPPPKPDFIVKGEFLNDSSKPSGQKSANISSSLADLRSRLTPDCTGITGLANIQISKVTSGQQVIPENGINLKGTSVTLTKVKNPDVKCDFVGVSSTVANITIPPTNATGGSAHELSSNGPSDLSQHQHQHQHSPPPQPQASLAKGKKKKKKGTGARSCGDDWNLVGENK